MGLHIENSTFNMYAAYCILYARCCLCGKSKKERSSNIICIVFSLRAEHMNEKWYLHCSVNFSTQSLFYRPVSSYAYFSACRCVLSMIYYNNHGTTKNWLPFALFVEGVEKLQEKNNDWLIQLIVGIDSSRWIGDHRRGGCKLWGYLTLKNDTANYCTDHVKRYRYFHMDMGNISFCFDKRFK